MHVFFPQRFGDKRGDSNSGIFNYTPYISYINSELVTISKVVFPNEPISKGP